MSQHDTQHHTQHDHAHRPRPLVDVLVGLTMIGPGRARTANAVADIAELGADDRVADIGCGPGTAARVAAARGASVVGVDPSPGMRWLVRTLTRGPNGARVTYVDGSAEATGLDDASVTVVWALASAHHWPDLDAGVREAARILAPSGRIVVLERVATGQGLHGRHGFTRNQADELAARLDATGFADVAVTEHELGRQHLSIRATRT